MVTMRMIVTLKLMLMTVSPELLEKREQSWVGK